MPFCKAPGIKGDPKSERHRPLACWIKFEKRSNTNRVRRHRRGTHPIRYLADVLFGVLGSDMLLGVLQSNVLFRALGSDVFRDMLRSKMLVRDVLDRDVFYNMMMNMLGFARVCETGAEYQCSDGCSCGEYVLHFWAPSILQRPLACDEGWVASFSCHKDEQTAGLAIRFCKEHKALGCMGGPQAPRS